MINYILTRKHAHEIATTEYCYDLFHASIMIEWKAFLLNKGISGICLFNGHLKKSGLKSVKDLKTVNQSRRHWWGTSMSWCWAVCFQRCRHGSGLCRLERTANQLGKAWYSKGWDQQVSKFHSRKTGTGHKKKTTESEAPLPPGRVQTACDFVFTHTAASCISLPAIFPPGHYSECLGQGRDMQVGWGKHWTLCMSYGAYWNIGRESRFGLLSPALRGTGFIFSPCSKPKTAFSIWHYNSSRANSTAQNSLIKTEDLI